jgi:hypothetical protein
MVEAKTSLRDLLKLRAESKHIEQEQNKRKQTISSGQNASATSTKAFNARF